MAERTVFSVRYEEAVLKAAVRKSRSDALPLQGAPPDALAFLDSKVAPTRL